VTTVRFKGLVSLAEAVRKEIGRGLTPSAKVDVRLRVERAVGEVDRILRERRARVSQLAIPSKRAYQFLAGIRWEAIAETVEAESAASRPANGAVRWTGLGPFAERVMTRLGSRDVSEREIAEVTRAIASMSGRIEQSLRRSSAGPEHLTPATREWRGWFAWMAVEGNVRAYVSAARGASGVLEGASRRAGEPLAASIQFRPMRQIYKMRTRGGRATLGLPTPMVRFDAGDFEMLADLIYTHDRRDAKRRVVERMRSEQYVALADELEALAGVIDGARGAFHDLAASFERVNATYFDGQLGRPRLTWSRSFTGRKFGHYDELRDWVMVSSTLDHHDVPAFVVDYLMFHELLHKKHGIRWVNGRGHAHTREFYAEERRFPRFAEADAWLTKLAK